MSFCQAFPTTRDPHRDARTVKSTRNDDTTMDAARAPHPTREGACAPLTMNSTRKDHSTMDAARAPNKKGSLSAPSIVAYENGG